MNKRRNIISLIFIVFIFSLLFGTTAFAATSWVNSGDMYTGVGCALNVQNQRTGLWTCAINNSNYNSEVDWNSDINVGDELYIDAFTSFNGGKLWIYENGVCVTTIDAGYQQHIYYEYTVRTPNTKIACSASVNAVTGEALKINISAAGDSQPPVVTVLYQYNIVGVNQRITMTDNVRIAGYYVSKSSAVPDANDPGWIVVAGGRNVTRTYKPLTDGVYYVYAKDGVNNISDVVSFEAGYLAEVPHQEEVSAKHGENATFTSVPSSGTSPYTYQWFRNENNSNNDGQEVPITGQTEATYVRRAAVEDHETYYFCEVTNRFGSIRSLPTKLNVYFEPELGIIPDGTHNQGERHTFMVPITEDGNPDEYKFQWYVASTNDPSTSTGTRITGATSQSYSARLTENITQYYYCEVTNIDSRGNSVYTVTTNRAKLTTDVTKPEIKFGTISPANLKYINKSTTLTIPIVVTDTGEGYVENGNNFTSSDIVIYVNGVEQTTATVSLVHGTDAGDNHNYTLTLSNIPSDGVLAIEVPAGRIEDNFENGNEIATLTTEITVDNTVPKVSQHLYVSGANDVYVNKQGTIAVKLVVEDNKGIDSNDFTIEDIVVKINGNIAGSDLSTSLAYDSLSAGKYIYNYTISNASGNGELSVTIPAGSIKDRAGNPNAETSFSIVTDRNEAVIVDNTAPTLDTITATVDSFESGVVYPTGLAGWRENWTNKNIFIILGGTDNNEVDYYKVSRNGDVDENYSKLTSNQDIIQNSFDGNMYYRVYDKAGNYATNSIPVRIDKTAPNPMYVGVYELREGGAEYYYDETIPSNKTLFVKALPRDDKGDIRSGVMYDPTGQNGDNSASINGNWYSTYYVLIKYDNQSKTTKLDEWKMTINSPAVKIEEDGYYEAISYTIDKANNFVQGPIRQIYINKRTDNTIKVSNIMDTGSGVKSLTIKVCEGTNASGREIISPIVVENPYKEYSTTVRLGRGTFYVEATLEDNSGLVTTYHKIITNDF